MTETVRVWRSPDGQAIRFQFPGDHSYRGYRESRHQGLSGEPIPDDWPELTPNPVPGEATISDQDGDLPGRLQYVSRERDDWKRRYDDMVLSMKAKRTERDEARRRVETALEMINAGDTAWYRLERVLQGRAADPDEETTSTIATEPDQETQL